MRATLNCLLTSVILVVLILVSVVSCSADLTSDSQLLQSYMKDREWDSALSQLKTLISTYPDEAASFIIGDETKDLWGLRLPDAIAVLKQAVDLSQKDDVGLKLRVALLDCYKNQDEWDKAFPLLETIKADYPDKQCMYHYFKSICSYFQDKYEIALDEMREALDLYDGLSDEKAFLSQILNCYETDKQKLVIWVVYDFLRYGPEASAKKKADFYRWAGLVCIKVNRPVESTTAYRKSLELYDLPDDEKTFIGRLLDCYSSSADKSEISLPGVVYALLSDSPGSSDEKKAELYKHVGLVCLQQAHRPVEAATAFNKAVQLNNASGQATGLGFILSNVWIDGEKLLQDLDKTDCKDADALNYCKAIAKYYQMYNYLNSKQYEKAIPVCKEIVSSNIDGGLIFTALTVMAECMYPLGRIQEAYNFADEYYRAHPDRQIEADLFHIKSAFWAERDWQKVISLCEEFIATYSSSSIIDQVQDLRVQALQFTGQNRLAAEAIERKLDNASSDDDRVRLLERLGNLHLDAKDYSASLKSWEELMNSPDASRELKARAMYNAGYCYKKTGNDELTEKLMRSVTEQYPDTQAAKDAKITLSILFDE